MGLNLDWVKSYGLRCSLRPRASSANSQKIATDRWSFGTKVMTKNTKTRKTQKMKISVFVQNRKKKEMEIFTSWVINF